MELRILGLLEVVEGGRPVRIGRGKESALLAVLLINAKQPVSVERLVEELWEGSRLPENAAKTVQIYVSRLRRRLGPDRIVTTPAGYMLTLEPLETDAGRFEQLAGEGQAHLDLGEADRAEAVLTEALGLWRGEALSEFRFDAFARAEIARLEERRRGAIADRLDARLALGQAMELIGELEAVVRTQPLHERPRRQLMLALYRAGRHGEALDAYQAARSTLVEELGIEPSRSLRDLHQQILNQDPDLDVVARSGQRVERPTGATAPRLLAEPRAPRDPQDTPGGSESAPRPSRKTVTVTCVRLEVVPRAGEQLDPELVDRVAGRAFGECRAASERHGGSVETVSSLSLTAVFGLPVAHEDDALRAVRASVESREALMRVASEVRAERAVGLEWRVGVSTGEVIAGGAAAGDGRATGEPLTRSARIATSRGIAIDGATHRLVRDWIVAEQTGDLWSVIGLGDAASRESRLASPMVGRERERRRLRDAFEQAVGDHSCQLFTVLGPAGVGKSRLVQELLGELGSRALVGRGRCLPYGEGITFWPLAEVIAEVAGLDGRESSDDAIAVLATAFGEASDRELEARLVAETIGLVGAIAPSEERFAAVQALFVSLAQTRPLVAVFDDIHWGETTLLDLIEQLAERVRDVPILLVCLARPELLERRPAWGGGKLNVTTTLLEPLSSDQCAALIEHLIGPGGLPGEVAARIAEGAEGNPLFVEEMLLMMIDDGQLVNRDGRWVLGGETAALAIPPTIHALLDARLDQLHASERAVIEPAAIVGKVFYEGAVSELVPSDLRDTVAVVLDSLRRKDLIRPERASLGERAYRFRHLLIRDAAYDSIPKQTRAELHERFGRWLVRAAGTRAIEYEEVVGYHLEQAYRYLGELGALDDAARSLAREAAELLGSAGRRAFVRSDGPAGVNLISRAVTLLPPGDPLRVELIPNVRVVQGLATDLAWADRVLTEAIEAAATTGDSALGAHALVQQGLLRLFTGPDVTAAEMIEVARRATTVFHELGDELGLARSWRLAAHAHYLARCAGACGLASERALKHATAARDQFEQREIIEALAIALLLGPEPASAAAARCRALSREFAAKPLLQAEILAAQAPLEAMLGHTDKAAELIQRSNETVEPLNASIFRISLWRAFILLWLGDPAGAEDELLPAYHQLKLTGERSDFSSITQALAQARFGQGRHAEAEQLTHECEQACRPNDVHSQIGWRTIRAKTLAKRGQHQAAETLARSAVTYAETTDFLLSHADAATGLADVLASRGREREAIETTQLAISLYERKGNTLAAHRAAAMLAELTR